MNSRLEAELSEVKTSFANLLALADAGGTDIAGLLTRMREKQSRLQILEAQLSDLKAQQQRDVT